MQKFHIPDQLQETLEDDRALSGLINTAISEFGVWLDRNNVKFFSEYTEHGLQHVQDVLVTANELIREQSRGIIKSADVAILILASLLHDCAMHISIDGFINLVQSNNQPSIKGFNDRQWNLLWLDFLAETRRYSGRKLMALFGDTEPVRHPPMDPQEMNGRDLLLCGEFLRKHHHRLAHEIALYGVPGHSENKLTIPRTEDTEHIVDLAGVIARSHGLPIRDCFDYLHLRYSNVKKVRNSHPVYMMALLRIADILQIHKERAPIQVQKVIQLQSPVSLAEWEMHQAIKDVNFNDPPETIFVVAEPKNVGAYLKIRKLLDQIQNELDKSWTVIGEVYSYDNRFRELGLTIRRVSSNIDDVAQFSKKVSYLPIQASFEVADTDLLKLLIAPLYGEKPEIGVRELLQNSIDAVRELKEYQKQNPKAQNIELSDHEADVLISIYQEKDEKWWIEVSDKGMGMTPSILQDYFLKAGASLRRSEIWRKTFEDAEGKSRVLRSGRFGVGALAAFLLGDELHISTRHVTDESGEGVKFQSKLDSESIEFQRVPRPVGTTIKVQISNEVKEALDDNHYSHDWYWYYLDEPVVSRKINGEEYTKQSHIPSVNAELPNLWRRIHQQDYADIQWSYSGRGFYVNGILVDKYTYPSNLEDDDNKEEIKFISPQISVFDFDARLPLNLQRTELTSPKYPFQNELKESILRDFIAFLLVNGPTQPITNTDFFDWYFRYHYIGTKWESDRRIYDNRTITRKSFWYSTVKGFGLRNNWSLNRLNLKTALVITQKTYNDVHRINLFRNQNPKTPTYIPEISALPEQALFGYINEYSETLNDKVSGLNNILKELVPDYPYRGYDPKMLYNHGIRILVSRNVIRLLNEAEEHSSFSGFQPFWSTNQIDMKNVEEWSNNDWVLWRIGDCKVGEFDFSKFAEANTSPNEDLWPCILAEQYFLDEKEKIERFEEWKNGLPKYLRHEVDNVFDASLLEKVWMDVLGSPIIPFDMNDRREKLAHAYKELKPYIEAHEALKEKHEIGDE